jgi:hypothetical protein
MNSKIRSLLAATGLGLALAAPLAIAHSPSSAGRDATASQGREGHQGRHAARHGTLDSAGQPAVQAQRKAWREAMGALTTEEERATFRAQLRNADPDTRGQLMQARRAQLQQRADERGVVLPAVQPHGERGGPRHVAGHGGRGDRGHGAHAGRMQRGHGDARQAPAPVFESM